MATSSVGRTMPSTPFKMVKGGFLPCLMAKWTSFQLSSTSAMLEMGDATSLDISGSSLTASSIECLPNKSTFLIN